MFGLKYGQRATALVAAGVGSGSPPGHRAEFIKSSKAMADRWLKDGSEAVAQSSGVSPTRIQLLNKDPRGWSEFVRFLGEHSAEGSAMTMRHYQGERPSLEDFAAQFRSILVTANSARYTQLPDVPSAFEAGIPRFEVNSYFGLLAPRRTPPEVIQRLNAEMQKVLGAKEIREMLQRVGMEPAGGTPERFAEYIANDARLWGPAVKASGAKLD